MLGLLEAGSAVLGGMGGLGGGSTPESSYAATTSTFTSGSMNRGLDDKALMIAGLVVVAYLVVAHPGRRRRRG